MNQSNPTTPGAGHPLDRHAAGALGLAAIRAMSAPDMLCIPLAELVTVSTDPDDRFLLWYVRDALALVNAFAVTSHKGFEPTLAFVYAAARARWDAVDRYQAICDRNGAAVADGRIAHEVCAQTYADTLRQPLQYALLDLRREHAHVCIRQHD
jgi:hypothetical protein